MALMNSPMYDSEWPIELYGTGRLDHRPRGEINASSSRRPLLIPSRPVVGTIRKQERRVGRNDPCPCESGKKFKHCCIDAKK